MSEDICLTACQDEVHLPPRVVPAPVDNSTFSWLHQQQASAVRKPVRRIVGQELVLVLLLIPQLSTVSSDEEMYCSLHMVVIIFIWRDPSSGHFHLPKYKILQTTSGFICVRPACCIAGARIHSFQSGLWFSQLLSSRLPVDAGQP